MCVRRSANMTKMVHLALENEGTTILRNVGTTEKAQRHIIEGSNPQPHRCENFESRLAKIAFGFQNLLSKRA
jgi:hypothetical protein